MGDICRHLKLRQDQFSIQVFQTSQAVHVGLSTVYEKALILFIRKAYHSGHN